MRVCFVSALHPPQDKRVFDKEARTLVAAGFDVVHVAPGDGGATTIDGVRIVTYPGPKGLRDRIGQLARLYCLARDVGADVYHCNEVDSWAVGVALRLFRGTPCVFDVHEHYPEDFAEMRFPVYLRPAVRLIVRVVMQLLSIGTSRVVLAKRSLRDDFRWYPAARICLVQNFVSMSSLPAPVSRLESDGQSLHPLRLIHLGLVNRVRGWPQMLEGLARARHSDAELVILGEIGGGEEAEFMGAVERLGLGGRVRYLPWLPFAQAMEEVMAADVGVIMFQPGFFNHVHALPHKLFDYMAACLPVIAPDFAVEVSHIVAEADCGLLVDSSESKAFADAVDHLAENAEQRVAMGAKGRAAVEKFYNWEAEGRKFVEMYQGLRS